MALVCCAGRMSYVQQQRPKGGRPWWVWPTVGSIFVVLILVACWVGSMLADVESDPVAEPQSQVSTVADSVNTSGLAEFWSSHYKLADWYPATELPKWDGLALTARTSIEGEPAARICTALAMYWLVSEQDFRPVKVIGSDGQVLMSKSSMAGQCTTPK